MARAEYGMRILIIYHAEARRIYQALAESHKVELTVGLPEKVSVDRVYDPSGWLCAKREEYGDGYRLIPLPLKNPLNYWQGFQIAQLWRLIKQTRPDIIHVLSEPASPYLFQVVWLRLTACPRSKVLFYGWENLPIHFLGPLSRLKWKLTWAQIAGGVAANSETLKNVRHAGFPPDRPLQRIFWGIPTEIFKPMNRLALKEELRLDCEYVVGYVGRLVPQKGLTVLLAAVRCLPSSVHCLIVGSGPMRAELELQSGLPDLSGRIHIFDAMRPNALARYMNCMDVLAIPSLTTSRWKEQYGRVIGEAMACGVPVVGSDSGAIPEVMGSAGLIVPEGNAPALAEALQRAVFDQKVRAHLIQQGLERVEQELSVEAMSQQLLRFYNRILEA